AVDVHGARTHQCAASVTRGEDTRASALDDDVRFEDSRWEDVPEVVVDERFSAAAAAVTEPGCDGAGAYCVVPPAGR
ncbi:MAG: hypothetical protein R3320_12865, partial [Nitriliruptorales bacterium]|nr:hypothetical protein [Nitriliruptorales bacterium]